MRYAIYDDSTGQIHSIVTGAFESATLQLTAGNSLLEMVTGDDSTHYVSDGVLVAITSAPSGDHVFNWANKQWEDLRTLPELRGIKWQQVKNWRDVAFNTPLATPYGIFDSDPISRARISDAVLLTQTLVSLSLPADTDFTLADNTSVTLLPAEMVTVGLLLGQKVQAAFAQARDLRAQINAATSVSELEAITWTI